MKAPESLKTLIEYGIIQEVIRPLMSGKEAQVFVVVAGGEECVAKVYKEATHRTFKHRAEYTEGRRTRNTRDQRAINKRTQHGKKKDEDAWRSTEVDMIYRLRDAGVRVPEPLNFVEGVLEMELVKGADGDAAPRLGDLSYSAAEAKSIYDQLIQEVVRMLCAGVIHGDLSDFNVLMASDGPVVIDFPQSIDPTHNPNGEKLLLRDVENLHRFLARFAPEEEIRPYGQEIWKLFQANKLRPDTKLSGVFVAPSGKVNTTELMGLIADATKDEARRRAGPKTTLDEEDEFEAARDALGATPSPFRKVVDFSQERRPRRTGSADPKKREAKNPKGPRADAPNGERPRRRSRRGRDENAGDGERSARAGRPRRAPADEQKRGNEKSASRRGPPRGPRALVEKEEKVGRQNAEGAEGAEGEQARRPRRPRNRRRRGGASKARGEQGAQKENPAPRAVSSGPSRPKSDANSGSSRPSDSTNPPRRRRRRRPRKKPDAE